MTKVIKISDKNLSKKHVDKPKIGANNKVKGEVEYARYSIDQQDAENQFRRLQEASKRLSDREVALYLRWSEQVDEVVRGRFARVFRNGMETERSRLRYDNRVLINPKIQFDKCKGDKICKTRQRQTIHKKSILKSTNSK